MEYVEGKTLSQIIREEGPMHYRRAVEIASGICDVKDTALVCLHSMTAEKQTHLFVVERPNSQSAWDISARISLDVPEFASPNWSFEPHDADKDGFEEVIFSASNSANTARRVLVYVPRTRQSYWTLADLDASGKPVKTTFSPNAETPNSAAFKSALEQYAAGKRS